MSNGALWYQDRGGKCRHIHVTRDGRRRAPCERFARHGTEYCPAHTSAHRPYDAQQAAVVIASVFEWVPR